MIKGKKVLVTGGAGFIGSHLVEGLLAAGAEVSVMVRYNSSSSRGNLEMLSGDDQHRVEVLFGNIEDSDFVARVMDKVDIVFHLAALIAIPYSYLAPRSYVRTNVEGTLNVLEAARRIGTERIIHTSTSEVYGTAIRTPIDEHHPLQGQSPYSASKIAADMLAESYYRSFDLPVVTVRPFNTFGPRQSARAFIPTIISQALEREEIHLGSLEPERDMTYVTDTVAGFIAAASASGVAGETINLGTGETHSIGYFANRILDIMGLEREIKHDAGRMRPEKSEVMKLVSDNRKATSLLNWRPRVALEDGLRQSIDFVDSHRDLYRSNVYTV
jgi:NAD dependent epimerase/dehydratase